MTANTSPSLRGACAEAIQVTNVFLPAFAGMTKQGLFSASLNAGGAEHRFSAS